ncbi:hypothetical protein FEZ18_02600 [Oceanihabitans sp. IOP_32]|uniref:hypothetical protein n=1 Tax=Oceanihabitans sp. IOP_32 TaxID=2529032 RepID=UPI00129333CB|nr:hypothetical protein [Oceanihabitans sp. IOP_32]QFZ53773.1 hypothetical protein FEZ18_02600 [Oceanihabitans sp. IOP_32]
MKNNSLHNKNNSGFKTPNSYFESFDETFFTKLKHEEKLSDLKSAGFKTPKAYFNTVDDNILNRINSEKGTKVISLFSWKNIALASSVAASLVLMFHVFFNSDQTLTLDSLETAAIENYLVEVDFTSIDFAALLTEDDITADALINHDFSEDIIEDYLIDNTDLEDLLTE